MTPRRAAGRRVLTTNQTRPYQPAKDLVMRQSTEHRAPRPLRPAAASLSKISQATGEESAHD